MIVEIEGIHDYFQEQGPCGEDVRYVQPFDIMRTVFLRACRLLQNHIRMTSRS